MGDNKTKFRAGYADAVLAFNAKQMREQQKQKPGLAASRFQNDFTAEDGSGAYQIEATDVLFYLRKPHIGRAGTYSRNVPTNPKVQSALTGLQTLPSGPLDQGIVEIAAQTGMSDDMLNLAILAAIQIVGIALFDQQLESAASKSSCDMTVLVSGIVTTQAYEKMHAGGYARLAMPPRAKYLNGSMWRGPGKYRGKITPIIVMSTPRDVTSYASTLMSEYIYNQGRRALTLLRRDANMNMFANFAMGQKELALTYGILFDYVMRERGFTGMPYHKNGVRNALPANARPGAHFNINRLAEGRENFGQLYEGNSGRIFFQAGPGGVYGEDPVITHPAEMAVFHGAMTGLLQPLRTGPPTPAANPAQRYGRAIQHADHVATSPQYADDLAAYLECVERFFKLAFPNSSAGGSQAMHEFGLSPFGVNRQHIARTIPQNPEEFANPTDDLYGHMLVQQKQAFPYAVGGVENLFNFNQGLTLGKVLTGATPVDGAERNFQYYYNL